MMCSLYYPNGPTKTGIMCSQYGFDGCMLIHTIPYYFVEAFPDFFELYQITSDPEPDVIFAGHYNTRSRTMTDSVWLDKNPSKISAYEFKKGYYYYDENSNQWIKSDDYEELENP